MTMLDIVEINSSKFDEIWAVLSLFLKQGKRTQLPPMQPKRTAKPIGLRQTRECMPRAIKAKLLEHITSNLTKSV